MATVLNKDLVRESTEQVDDKNLVVTLKSDQSIELKLKGVRGGDVLNIPIIELWEYLGGDVKAKPGEVKAVKRAEPKKGDNKMISLYDLRSENAISELDYADKAKFDGIISDLIKSLK